ncbi:FUSC family protein [Fangia hongkongensis]|uniref:FUSC family protein n=1 Tax=Fangia hongkongensis TaxID=270495 RepID=UPI0003657F34|nr:FUSC family protein [Fangia hongkongensis]MBK2124080.1 FUSC family protein [Fangia hongkongensis]
MSEIDKLTLYRSVRISLVLVFAIFIWLLFDIERGYWIPMSLMIIYLPFEPGAVSNRISLRFKGTVIGLFLGLLLVSLLRLDELFMMLIPVIVLLAMYFSLINYYYATVFITMGVMVIFAFLPTAGMSAESFMLARIIDTLIACIICFIAEVLFKPRRMIALTIGSSLEGIFSSYARHYQLMESAFKAKKYDEISFEEAMNFNNILTQLKLQVEVNKTKLPEEKQRQLDICLAPIFKMRTHFASIQYLSTHYPQKAQHFYHAHQNKIAEIGRLLSEASDVETSNISLESIQSHYFDSEFSDQYNYRIALNFNRILDDTKQFLKGYLLYKKMC